MSQRKLRFGVMGVGRIGKIHIENLANRISGTGVVALADVIPEELAAVSAKFDIPQAFPDYRQVLELPDVDAVVVCTPTNIHAPIVLDAAARGKHIFCEKPLDLSLERIAAINAAVEKAGVKLMVGFNRRFDPNFLKVHETIKSGKIGTPYVLRITSRDPAPPPEDYLRASGGIFLDMTIHDFDMARYLMGSEVLEVYAKAQVLIDPVFREAGDWDTAVVTLAFEGGALGTIDNSRKAVYGYDQRIEVFGSEGMVTVKNNTPDNHVRFDRSGVHSSLPLNFFMDRYADSYRNEMQAFVESIQLNKPVPVSGHDGFMAVVTGMAAGVSARENRPVSLSEIRAKRSAPCEAA